MRLEFERYEGLNLLIDCYNANPASVTTSLQSLRDIDVPGRRIVILGDMLELGESSADFHYRTGEEVVRSGVDMLFCLGPESRHIVEGAHAAGMDTDKVFHFTNHQDLLGKLLDVIARGDLILCKGSRGMELEKIIIGLKGAAFKRN
jgi:UDP-N-acetylmuramoyl-tripeptide--D-alanyl-D-alanine ligase